MNSLGKKDGRIFCNRPDDNFQPDWAKPQNWPERRRAPGYPRRFVAPVSIVVIVAVALAFWGFEKGPTWLVWIALGVFLVGHGVVYHFTLSRLRCPKCSKWVTLKSYPGPGHFFRFHCRDCNIIWLTGIRVSDNVGD
jgi:hypothetical protein